jgi:hypothetical protein
MTHKLTNTLGCTAYAEWSSDFPGQPLADQLHQAGVAVERLETPHLGGWAGNAYLLLYTSPKTGQPMVVLCVPRMIAADAGAESYFYFPASVFSEHPDEQWWIDAYATLRRAV